MAQPLYPAVAGAIEMHRHLIEEFGGRHGLRDRAALEAAVFRPQIGYYNSLTEEAAALMESLVNNHSFVDGNKRIGFALADTFLRANGFYLEVKGLETHKFIMGAMSKGEFRFGVIDDWISAHVKPL